MFVSSSCLMEMRCFVLKMVVVVILISQFIFLLVAHTLTQFPFYTQMNPFLLSVNGLLARRPENPSFESW